MSRPALCTPKNGSEDEKESGERRKRRSLAPSKDQRRKNVDEEMVKGVTLRMGPKKSKKGRFVKKNKTSVNDE